MAGDPRALETACKGGKFNGEVPTQKSNKTFPNQNHQGLDKAQQGSKAGILKKGK